MKKLITLSEKVKELSKRLENTKERFGSEWNLANRTKASEVCWLEIEGYSTFLDQPLTKEIVEGDNALLVGFEICNLGYKSKTHLIEFMNTYVSISLCVVYYGEEVYECIGNLPLSAPLHDLAELTKANQLELK